ncbi:hypothetical protein NDN08_003067 [Rhodosorus marinus]|uniref:30S ribosomal protein S15 n=1 Tax=Rhodosorus marinus TaxID=101924 RepID=A0AAV8UVL4_9RHOD|nr:hypothetical protein NDN08_003067 [Rhodosorus marinus]
MAEMGFVSSFLVGGKARTSGVCAAPRFQRTSVVRMQADGVGKVDPVETVLFNADVLGPDLLPTSSNSLMNEGKPMDLPDLEAGLEDVELPLRTGEAYDKKRIDTRNRFKTHENDSGSPEFQIAQLTVKIEQLTEHLNEHKKDYSSRRGLQAMVERRKKLFRYLYKVDVSRCEAIIKELGIRFNLSNLAIKNRYGNN